MPIISSANSVRFSGDRTRDVAIILFLALQILDLSSTLLAFARGGVEMNPVIAALMPFVGRLAAIFICKTALMALVWLLARHRKRLLVFANLFYIGIVVWNFSICWSLSA